MPNDSWSSTDRATCNSSEEYCALNVVNGSVLMVICLIGLVLNSLTIYIILVMKVPMAGNQKYFVLNLAITDWWLALLGLTMRGPGFISHHLFLGGPESWLCTMYTFIIMFFGYVNNMALVPITLDRFLAIMKPWRYKAWVNETRCTLLCLAVWLPNLFFLLLEILLYAAGSLEIKWNPGVGRCIFFDFTAEKTSKDVICLYIPLMLIFIMYICILKKMKKNDQETKQLLVTSTLVVIPSVLSWLPYTFVHLLIPESMQFKNTLVPWSYIVFYVTVGTNPLVYLFWYRNIRSVLKGSVEVVKKRKVSMMPTELGRSNKPIMGPGGKRISRTINYLSGSEAFISHSGSLTVHIQGEVSICSSSRSMAMDPLEESED